MRSSRRAIQAAVDRELARSLRDYTRAVAGGLVVGLPLLYTMEVWFQGFILPWWKLLVLLGIGFLVVLGYNAFAGFRRDRTVLELLVDSVDTIGLGIIVAFVALLFLGRIDLSTSLRDAAGKVALEAIPVAFGASVASTQLGGEADREPSSAFGRLLVAVGGALLFALNVAPTEEIVMLGTESPAWLLLATIVASLALTLALVFYADFGGRRRKRTGELLDQPLTETVAAYAASAAVALLLMWAFGRTDGASLKAIAGMTVVLAVVASVGAAVARLVIGGEHEESEAA
jgi:putative integral membrane protein (TIGR02587 family)